MRPDPSDLSIALTIPWDLKLVAFLSFLASPFEAVGHSPPNTQTCSPVEGKVISVRALVPGGKVQLPCRLAEATSFSGHLVAHSKSLATAHDSLLAVRWLKTSTSHSLSCGGQCIVPDQHLCLLLPREWGTVVWSSATKPEAGTALLSCGGSSLLTSHRVLLFAQERFQCSCQCSQASRNGSFPKGL